MEFSDVVSKRRSIRKFNGNLISKEILISILKDAQMAPSWKNSQVTRYHIITNQELISKIGNNFLGSWNSKNVESAGALAIITFIKNRSGFDREGNPDNELGNGWGIYDSGLASQNLVLSAFNQGIGSLIMGIRDANMIKKELSIPDEELIVSVIALGYTDIENIEAPKRKDIDDVVRFY